MPAIYVHRAVFGVQDTPQAVPFPGCHCCAPSFEPRLLFNCVGTRVHRSSQRAAFSAVKGLRGRGGRMDPGREADCMRQASFRSG